MPNALLTSLQPAEVSRRLAWAFDHVPRAVGVNNHMGSRATADPALMLAVLSEIRRRGLVFVDSRTTGTSVAPAIAQRLGVPIASRDIFLDNIPTSAVVLAQLEAAERVATAARQRHRHRPPLPGDARGTGDWLPAAERRGLRLVTRAQPDHAGGALRRHRLQRRRLLRLSPCRWRSGPPPRPPGSRRGPCSAISWYSASGSLS